MSNYSNWKLDDLKELRRRKVKVSGKKAELVERLTYLDSIGRHGTRVSIPGHPFPVHQGFPLNFHSRVPGNRPARFPDKREC